MTRSWMAPSNACLEIESRMSGLLDELHALGCEVDRMKHVGDSHERMVTRMGEIRAELLQLCAAYPGEHAKLKGGHRADGWTPPRE